MIHMIQRQWLIIEEKEEKKNNPNSSTVVIISIPHNLNNVGKLDEHFSKFGRIMNIQVEQSKKKKLQ